MLFLWSIRRPIQGTQRSKPLLTCSREDHSFLKLMVFAFYAGKLWNVLICSGHQLLHRLWDEDVYPLWTSCQFISLRDGESYCFPPLSSLPILHFSFSRFIFFTTPSLNVPTFSFLSLSPLKFSTSWVKCVLHKFIRADTKNKLFSFGLNA